MLFRFLLAALKKASRGWSLKATDNSSTKPGQSNDDLTSGICLACDYCGGISTPARVLSGKKTQVKRKSASFFEVIVPGWNEADFERNFRVSGATSAYLVNELQTTLKKQELLRSPIPVDHLIAIAPWRLGQTLNTKQLVICLVLTYQVLA